LPRDYGLIKSGFNSAEHVINLFRVNNNIQFCFFGIYFSPSKPKHCLSQFGDVTATVLTGRHQDTVWGNIDHYVRHAHPGTYQGTALLSTSPASSAPVHGF
jgi:hypothetical protein